MRTSERFRGVGAPVARLSVPILVEQAGIVLMGTVNTMLAANLGKETISAVGMVEAIGGLVIALFGALAIGGTVAVAQRTGEENREEASRAGAQALLSMTAFSVAVTAALLVFGDALLAGLFGEAEPAVRSLAGTYLSIVLWSFLPSAFFQLAFGVLRGSGDTRTPMAVSLIMNLVNVAAGFVLIRGVRLRVGGLDLVAPSLGIRGAALALLLARLVGAALVLAPLFRTTARLRIADARLFRFDAATQRRILSVGIPASLEQLMFNGGKLVVQRLLVSLGTVAMAANAIAGSAAGLLMVPGVALSTAAVTLVGQEVGRRDPAEARRRLSFVVLVAMAGIGLLDLAAFPFSRALLGLYTQDAATLAAALPVLWSVLVAQVLLWPAAFITPSGLRGAGDVRYTMTVSILSMWLLRIVLGYLLALPAGLGVLGVWIGMYADWAARAAFFLRRMRGSAWLRGAGGTFRPSRSCGSPPGSRRNTP